MLVGRHRRFQPVYVPEPTVDETYQILLGLRERYEAHHKLRYTDEALDAAAKHSHQYISDRWVERAGLEGETSGLRHQGWGFSFSPPWAACTAWEW